MEMEWWLAAVAVMLAGIVRGFSGFGAGLILVPSLGLVYGPLSAVVSVVILELIPAAQLMPRAIKHCHWNSVVPMMLAAGITVPMGSFVLVIMDEHAVRSMIAIMVLLATAVLASGWRFSNPQAAKSGPVMTGALSGMLSGAAGLGGLPVVIYYLSGVHRADVTRSSIIMFLFVTVMISLCTFIYHGIVTQEIVLRCLSFAPILLAATWLGGRIFGRVSEDRFRSILMLVMSAVGLITLAV